MISNFTEISLLVSHWLIVGLFVYVIQINLKSLRSNKDKIDRIELISDCILTWVSYTEVDREVMVEILEKKGNVNIKILNVSRGTK